jgi:hypothetical protein
MLNMITGRALYVYKDIEGVPAGCAERIGGVSERRLAFSKLQNWKSHSGRISAGVLLEGPSLRSRTAGREKWVEAAVALGMSEWG